MENEIIRAGISPVFVVILFVLAAAVIALLFLNRGKKNNSSVGKISFGTSQPTPPTPPPAEPELPDLTDVLNRRILLEEQMVGLIGGTTGLIELRSRINGSAMKGDVIGFRMVASIFPQKSKRLQEHYDELMLIIKNDAYVERAKNPEDITARRLAAPFKHQEICEQLFAYSKTLEKSGLLNRTDVTGEELLNWYNAKFR